MIKVAFLGTPPFVQPIKTILAKHFTIVDSLNVADLAVIAAYGHILTKKELETPKFGCINVHPSLLPIYRGPSPIQTAILNGDKVSGITIIKMDEEIDHGPILYQDTLELSDRDNYDTLSKKMFLVAAKVLPQIIKDFIKNERVLSFGNKLTPIPQNHYLATYCEHLTKESGFIDIADPPKNLDNMIRAYFPWPGVWTRWNGKIVKFLPEEKLQMEGKKVISYKDFLNGYPDFPLRQLQEYS